MIKFIPFRAMVTITLRNELGSSIPVVINRNNRNDIFSAIIRDNGLRRQGGDDLSDIAWIGYQYPPKLCINGRGFYRGKFSARVEFAGSQDIKSITFFICGYDVVCLASEKAGFKAWQTFIDIAGPPFCPLPSHLLSCLAHFIVPRRPVRRAYDRYPPDVKIHNDSNIRCQLLPLQKTNSPNPDAVLGI